MRLFFSQRDRDEDVKGEVRNFFFFFFFNGIANRLPESSSTSPIGQSNC